eukprot:c5283_g1_i1.p1 GENE.c5283_g1_i1~~c5283_g1_i1.p1  ORF type:complete len:348 (-),score=75.72 c5283_g1_i1:537-1580(-)
MGQCACKEPRNGEAEKNKKIEDELKSERQKLELKLLLLGAGESGKSTIFKQMQIIHNHGFTNDQRASYAPIIRKHCVETFQDLVRGAQILGLLTSELEDRAKAVLAGIEQEGLGGLYIQKIVDLWKTDNFQQAFAQRNQYQISDSAKYFLDHLELVAAADYVPTYDDILQCRVRTTGVSEIHFEAGGAKFRMVDVGGQRNERRKWIHCFQDVEGVIFVAAINEYDQVLFEDEKTNRLKEALRLFQEISNTRFFSSTSMILFLNKKDLFEEKIKTVDLNSCFPEYIGGCDYNKAVDFIKNKFSDARNSRTQEIFIHITTATSTGNVRFVFESVRESILMHNVHGSGIL